MKELEILRTETLNPNPTVKKATKWIIKPPEEINTFTTLIGIDPGTVNLGIAKTNEDGSINLYQIKLARDNDPVNRIKLNYFLMTDLNLKTNLGRAVIEGASFGSHFRQVEMAEQRATLALWLIQRGTRNVHIIPPNTIRKKVFGKGKLSAHDVWSDKEIDRDALAALSCLYYANEMEK